MFVIDRQRFLNQSVAVWASIFVPIAAGQVVVESHFDADAEGWTAVSFPDFCTPPVSLMSEPAVSWLGSGGVPGGYIRFTELGSSGVAFYRAPAAFLGDRSVAYGGTISAESRFSTQSDDIFYPGDDIYLQGAGITIVADIPNQSRDAWGGWSVPLREGSWRVATCDGPFASEGQIRAVLGSIDELFIRIEQAFGTETLDLDRVVIDATPSPELCTGRWSELDNATPTGRWRHAVAIDTERNILVLFGGETGETDTWEYDLQARVWTRSEPAASPSRRGGHAMAYDAARRRIVLTGGGYLGQATAEVWEYDTLTDQWTEVTPLDRPRSGHAMAYDSDRSRLVLYGGVSAGGTNATDVIERSALDDAWLVRSSVVNPGAQFGASLAYDSGRGVTVLAGQGTTSVSVAEWNGVSGEWTLRSFEGSVPVERENPVLVYDTARGRSVLMGGEGNASVWEYDGIAWSQRSNTPSGGRDEHAAAYDPASGRVILSGGILGTHTPQRDLLAYSGTQNAWATEWTASACGPRAAFGMFFDEAGQRSIAFGGGLATRAGLTERLGSGTFAFDGSVWTNIQTSGDPGVRWFAPLVYDPNRRTAMLFGGTTSAGSSTAAGATGRFWVLDLATMSWTERSGLNPGRRYDHAASFDRDRGMMVMHGGFDDLAARLGDTWLYSPATDQWTTLPAGAASPGQRNGAGMVFDEARGVTVLFGGRVGPEGRYDNSTWEFDGESWVEVTLASGNPAARLGPVMVYDPDRGAVLMYGGLMNRNFDNNPDRVARAYEDLWKWDGVAWTRLGQAGPMPTARVASKAVYDRSRGQLVHFGGDAVDRGQYRNGQTWALTLPPAICGCAADADGDGTVTIFDIIVFLGSWSANEPSGDFDLDGSFTIFDIVGFLDAWSGGCP